MFGDQWVDELPGRERRWIGRALTDSIVRTWEDQQAKIIKEVKEMDIMGRTKVIDIHSGESLGTFNKVQKTIRYQIAYNSPDDFYNFCWTNCDYSKRPFAGQKERIGIDIYWRAKGIGINWHEGIVMMRKSLDPEEPIFIV